jgi:hypothetical protein
MGIGGNSKMIGIAPEQAAQQIIAAMVGYSRSRWFELAERV